MAVSVGISTAYSLPIKPNQKRTGPVPILWSASMREIFTCQERLVSDGAVSPWYWIPETLVPLSAKAAQKVSGPAEPLAIKESTISWPQTSRWLSAMT